MATEAQRAACKRYYEKNKYRFRTVALRLDRDEQGDVLDKLDSVPNKLKYVVELVRRDIHGTR